jgi:hypothetical protein
MQQNTYSFVKFFGHGRLIIFMANKVAGDVISCQVKNIEVGNIPN